MRAEGGPSRQGGEGSDGGIGGGGNFGGDRKGGGSKEGGNTPGANALNDYQYGSGKNSSGNNSKAEKEAAEKAKKEAEEKAKAEAEREARKAKQLAEAQERQEAMAKESLARANESLTNGNLASTGGILSGLRMDTSAMTGVDPREPTQAMQNLGITSQSLQSVPKGQMMTDNDAAKLADAAMNERSTDMAVGFGSNVVGSMLGGLPGVGNLVESGINAIRDYVRDEQPDYERGAIDDMKKAMQGSGLVSGALSTAGLGSTYSAIQNGSTTAAKTANALSNPVLGMTVGVVDDAWGMEAWKDQNADFLNSHGINTEIDTNNFNRNNNGNGNGLLASLKTPPSNVIGQNPDLIAGGEETIDPYNTGWANQSSRFNFTF